MDTAVFKVDDIRLMITEKNGFITNVSFAKKEDVDSIPNNGLILECIRQLTEYFNGRRRKFDIPLVLSGTPFQKSVWTAISFIPWGTVCTYKELADKIGHPKAYRAVGMACNRNPVVIIIPCHRVLGSDGSLTGYAGGLDMKRKLLSLETALKKN